MSFEKKWVSEQIVEKTTGIKRQTLRNHRHKGCGIPYSKFGRNVRYLLSDVHDFMERHRINTKEL
ncbi:MAG: helix-turn-helix domain-containing protein [Deltaproteobacteria bacterium]|nr:helix-turn-helix domain-containing protein [Deltaproteobacteria bacterium]